MNDCEKINETPLPEKEDFQKHLNMEDITDGDWTNSKRAFKYFEITNLGEYHDSYCQLMYLRTLELCLLKYVSLILQNFFQLLYQHDRQL